MSEANVRLTAARQKAVEAREKAEEAQRVMAQTIKEAINDGFDALFAEHPVIGSVSWVQYTPYFNDGDECVFSAHIDEPSINSVKDIEEGTDNYAWEHGADFAEKCSDKKYMGWDPETRRSKYEPNPSADLSYINAEEDVIGFLRALVGSHRDAAHSAFRDAFGDHARVTVKRQGEGVVIEVDCYEHD